MNDRNNPTEDVAVNYDRIRIDARYYAKDLAFECGTDVFALLGKIRQMPFSVRARFWHLVDQSREVLNGGSRPEWPDALMFMSPVTFGAAALEALDWSERNKTALKETL